MCDDIKVFIQWHFRDEKKHALCEGDEVFISWRELDTNHQFIQSLSRVQLFATPWTAAHQTSLSFTISQSLLKFMSISRWCHPTI